MEGAVRLSFRDISISLNLKDGSSKQILDGVSGECTSGLCGALALRPLCSSAKHSLCGRRIARRRELFQALSTI